MLTLAADPEAKPESQTSYIRTLRRRKHTSILLPRNLKVDTVS